jgi:sulfane dehydrogenase subunit SoxC
MVTVDKHGRVRPDTPSSSVSRRHLIPITAGAAVAPSIVDGHRSAAQAADASGVPAMPTAKRPPPVERSSVFSEPEMELTFRNHGMLSELLKQPITPLGAHYLLIHFDVPTLSDENYTIAIGGRVQRPQVITLNDLKSRRTISQAVTMQCAGTGRALLRPRPVYVPWTDNAIGTYQWIGTPLRPLLEQAGLLGDATEVLFTGWDSGIDLGIEHAFERSMPVADAMQSEVMLAWAANGQLLLPQHGFPLRLIVPSWYGMASVKWLRAITVLNTPFQGVQQLQVYRYQDTPDDPGLPVREKRVNSVIMPPGIPDFLSRWRFVAPGQHLLQGMAWSGAGPVSKVEASVDGGASWFPTELSPVSNDPFAWVQWRAEWSAVSEGSYTLACRATDATGATQPLDPNETWNYQGNGINAIKRIPVVVQRGIGTSMQNVPSQPQLALRGGKLPPVPDAENQAVLQQ